MLPQRLATGATSVKQASNRKLPTDLRGTCTRIRTRNLPTLYHFVHWRDDVLSNFSDYHELEARFIQLESKYLVLLREYQEPHIGNDHIVSFIEYTKVCSRSPCTRK